MKKSDSRTPRVRPAKTPALILPRYQVYRQMRQGVFSAEFSTSSAVEAVEAFLDLVPAFKGGEVRIWNLRERRVVATVQWSMAENRHGVFVRRRTNVFHDPLLERVARQAARRKKLPVNSGK
jgi:hypothetical protein